jgi:hypothetical protein
MCGPTPVIVDFYRIPPDEGNVKDRTACTYSCEVPMEPRKMVTGSPGAAWIRMKLRMMIAKTTGTSCKIRPMM